MKLGVMSVLKTNSRDPLRIGLGHVKLSNGKKALVNLILKDDYSPAAFEMCIGHNNIKAAPYNAPENISSFDYDKLPKKVRKAIVSIDKDKFLDELANIFAQKKRVLLGKKIDVKFNFSNNKPVKFPIQSEVSKNETAAALDYVA